METLSNVCFQHGRNLLHVVLVYAAVPDAATSSLPFVSYLLLDAIQTLSMTK